MKLPILVDLWVSIRQAAGRPPRSWFEIKVWQPPAAGNMKIRGSVGQRIKKLPPHHITLCSSYLLLGPQVGHEPGDPQVEPFLDNSLVSFPFPITDVTVRMSFCRVVEDQSCFFGYSCMSRQRPSICLRVSPPGKIYGTGIMSLTLYIGWSLRK
jgi:hypothetical protein